MPYNFAPTLGYTLKTIGSVTVKVLEFDAQGKILRSFGITLPTDGLAGFAKGSIFLKTDVTAGTSGFYENVGTTTACNFDLIGAGGSPTTFVSLTDTPANYTAAANKIVKVNTGATALEFVAVSGDAAMKLPLMVHCQLSRMLVVHWTPQFILLPLG